MQRHKFMNGLLQILRDSTLTLSGTSKTSFTHTLKLGTQGALYTGCLVQIVYNTLKLCIHGSSMGFVNLFKILSLSQDATQICSDFVMSFHYIPCYTTSVQIQIMNLEMNRYRIKLKLNDWKLN